MIQNQQQVELVREQLAHLERALQDLEDQVRPQSEKQFRLMSEIYVEHIERLRREIDEHGREQGEAASTTKRGTAPRKRRSA